MRTMTFATPGEFVSCCFTGDSKFLVTMAGEPEFNIVYWKWDGESDAGMTATEGSAQCLANNLGDGAAVSACGAVLEPEAGCGCREAPCAARSAPLLHGVVQYCKMRCAIL